MRFILGLCLAVLSWADAKAMSGGDYIELFDQHRAQYSDDSVSANLSFYIFGLSDMTVAMLKARAAGNPVSGVAERQDYAACLLTLAGGKTPVEVFYHWLKQADDLDQSAGNQWIEFLETNCGVEIDGATASAPLAPDQPSDDADDQADQE